MVKLSMLSGGAVFHLAEDANGFYCGFAVFFYTIAKASPPRDRRAR